MAHLLPIWSLNPPLRLFRPARHHFERRQFQSPTIHADEPHFTERHHRRRLPEPMSHHTPVQMVPGRCSSIPLPSGNDDEDNREMHRQHESSPQPPIAKGKCMIGRDRASACELSHTGTISLAGDGCLPAQQRAKQPRRISRQTSSPALEPIYRMRTLEHVLAGRIDRSVRGAPRPATPTPSRTPFSARALSRRGARDFRGGASQHRPPQPATAWSGITIEYVAVPTSRADSKMKRTRIWRFMALHSSSIHDGIILQRRQRVCDLHHKFAVVTGL
jgi:hypothetical protein